MYIIIYIYIIVIYIIIVYVHCKYTVQTHGKAIT